MKKMFTEHPESVGENYFQHMGTSFSFGIRMFFGSFACFLHGVFPFLCTTRGSDTIKSLHTRMTSHRHKDPAQWARANDNETSTFEPVELEYYL